MHDKNLESKLMAALKKVAPGTELRLGLENILRAKTGALIMVGEGETGGNVVDGGFYINADFTPASLYELAKMDGAIILSNDAKKIIAANTQLIPNPDISSAETGIRHRTAERTAKETHALVIAISQRRGVITLFQGSIRYVLQETSVILTKANQALQTLEKYKQVLDKYLLNLSVLEFEDNVAVIDVVKAIRRIQMVMLVVQEIDKYISELGTEGRLLKMQMDELMSNVQEESLQVINDYNNLPDKSAEEIFAVLGRLLDDNNLDLGLIAKALGYSGSSSVLENKVAPKGYRMLKKIPRLPDQVIHNLVMSLCSLRNVLAASLEELDDVEGIGEVRAKAIKDGLWRYRDQLLHERHI